MSAIISPEAFVVLVQNHFHQSEMWPSGFCYWLLQNAAARKGWTIPSEKTVRRHLGELKPIPSIARQMRHPTVSGGAA